MSMPGGFGIRLLLLGCLVALVAVVAIDARATYGARTTADEPQYLMTALSLGRDLDLDVSEEIAGREYLDFHELALNEQTRPLDADGQRLSPHDPLLPVLLAGPMRIGGWRAAKAALAVSAGLTAAATCWVAVRRFGATEWVGLVATGGCFVSPPLVSYGTQVYPEMPAGLAVVIALAAFTGRLDRRNVLVGAASVTALAWLSVKYAPVCVALTSISAVRCAMSGRWRRLAELAVLLGVSGALYLLAHRGIYGGWTVYAAGDHFTDGEFGVVGFEPDYWGRSKRIYGLLVDRGFGLGAWAPAYLGLPFCLAALSRRRPEHWWALVVPLAAGWATATWVAFTMHGWWWPGRQLVVVLPLAVIIMTLALDRWKRLVWPFVGASALAACSWLWLVGEASTGRKTLIFDFESTTNPLVRGWSQVLPDHHRWPTGTWPLSIAWALLLVATVAIGWRAGRRRGAEPMMTNRGWVTSETTESPKVDEPRSVGAGSPSSGERSASHSGAGALG